MAKPIWRNLPFIHTKTVAPTQPIYTHIPEQPRYPTSGHPLKILEYRKQLEVLQKTKRKYRLGHEPSPLRQSSNALLNVVSRMVERHLQIAYRKKLLPSPPPQPFTLISLYPFPFYPFSVFPHTLRGNQYPTVLEPRTKE